MKIRKMTATFGGLKDAILTPGEGLTVIAAPNEGGKSTWTGFLKAMLYGIDTKERDKGGFIADKNRYQPWSGEPMWGELELEWEGREITLRRTTNKSGPLQGFEAVYTATGDPVPDLTAANVGQTIVGAGKDVFVRSAMVGQNGTMVTNNAELERRIAALATSGQEDVSHSATERTLKDWRNRRRSNRANGIIPELQAELERTEGALEDMALARRSRAEAEGQLKLLEEERRELTAEMDIHRRLAQKALNRRYALAVEEWQTAQAAIPSGEPHPLFGTMTGEEAWALAESREQARADALAENQKRASRREQLAREGKKLRTLSVLFAAAGVVGLVLLVLGMLQQLWVCAAAGGVALVIGVLTAILCLRNARGLGAQEGLEPLPVPPDGDELAQAAAYRETLARAQQAEAAVAAAKRLVDDLAAQGAQPFDTLEFLHTPERSPAETAARLGAVEGEIARWQTQLDRAIGALRRDPLELEARRDELRSQLDQRMEEYEALELALKGLDEANGVLRERFSPALNEEAAALFSALTGGKYHKLSLSRDFSALTGAVGESAPHSALYLSAGTVDQLYLAVRLAVCRLTLPDAPLLLDDALAAFDDRRTELALQCLKEQAAERQILLFTCHSREARWAQANGVPVIEL